MTYSNEVWLPKRYATPYEMAMVGLNDTLSPQVLGALKAMELNPKLYGEETLEYANGLDILPASGRSPFFPQDKIKSPAPVASRRNLTHFKKRLTRDHWMRDFLY